MAEFGAGTIAVIKGVGYAGLDNQKGTVVTVDVATIPAHRAKVGEAGEISRLGGGSNLTVPLVHADGLDNGEYGY